MDSTVRIPQSNPNANYLAHRREIDSAVARVLEGGRYILGPEVRAFEEEFAAYLGVSHAVGVGSGTDAIHLSLLAAGVGAGDEVITVSHTAVATVAAITRTGARPVFVDIRDDTLTLDPEQMSRAISARTKAVIPVHLYGQPADLEPILATAHRHGLITIEDCAQAHGAVYNGKRVGSWGDLGCFSFYPTKNLSALGDGGMVVTKDDHLALRVRLLREYGWRDRYVSELDGWNSRLDEIQAAVLRVKLRHLNHDNARRWELASLYLESLYSTGIRCPAWTSVDSHVHHLFVIRHPRRDELRTWLHDYDIGTGIHYPVPVHLQPAYAHLGFDPGSLPVTEQAAQQVLSLPMYPEMDRTSVARVASAIAQWEAEKG